MQRPSSLLLPNSPLPRLPRLDLLLAGQPFLINLPGHSTIEHIPHIREGLEGLAFLTLQRGGFGCIRVASAFVEQECIDDPAHARTQPPLRRAYGCDLALDIRARARFPRWLVIDERVRAVSRACAIGGAHRVEVRSELGEIPLQVLINYLVDATLEGRNTCLELGDGVEDCLVDAERFAPVI